MNKYHSRKTECRYGHLHDSKKEAEACIILNLMEKSGKIVQLVQQPKFILQSGFTGIDGRKVQPITYTADFQFFDIVENKVRVVDVKGFKTASYRIKKRLFDYKMRKNNIMLEEEI